MDRVMRRDSWQRGAGRYCLGGLLVLSGGLRSGHGWAQAEPSAAQIGAAREVGIEGLKLAEEGRCPEAIEKLMRAESLYSAPTTLGRLGECRVKVGKLVLGTEDLRRVVRTALKPEAPPAFRTAQERAQKVLDEALPRLAKVHVEVTGAANLAIELRLDGEPIPKELVAIDIPADPGSHRLEARAAGFLPESRQVELSEGGRETIRLVLRPDPQAAAQPASPASAPSKAPGAPPPEASPTRRYLSYGLLGVGAAGLAVGTVFGLIAVSRKGELDEECPKKECKLSSDGLYERTQTAGLVSTVGFGVGAVGAGLGLYLLLSSSSSSAQVARSVQVGPGPSPLSLGVQGAF